MANVKTYSKAKSGNVYLTTNFKVSEFACNDGSDAVLIDLDLVNFLQQIRDWAGAAVTINSAYRTATYNAKIGGASSSYHVKGQACDIVVSGKTVKQVAAYAEVLGMKGILRYDTQNFVHVDTRASKYWATVIGSSSYTAVSTFGGSSTAGPAAEKEKEVEDLTEAETRKVCTEVATSVVNAIIKGENTTVSGWAKDELAEAIAKGITDGTNPQGIATREQAAVMVLRATK